MMRYYPDLTCHCVPCKKQRARLATVWAVDEPGDTTRLTEPLTAVQVATVSMRFKPPALCVVLHLN